MRVSRSTKATALLLLVSLQYSFAALDVALCSSALCYPKVSGARVGKMTKRCPDGFSLEKDTCVKRVAKACTKKMVPSCSAAPAGGCPVGTYAADDCGAASGRHLLMLGNPVVKEVNIQGEAIIPTLILPKPAVSVTFAKAKPREAPKVTVNGLSHGIILPEPAVSINVPKMQKVGPEIRFEGTAQNIIPNIIPVLAEPPITIEVPHSGSTAPVIRTNITTKKVTVDLSQLGPKHTLDVNLPALPDIMHQATKMPDIELNVAAGDKGIPKVIDLSGLGPKKVYNVTLPEVKLPKQGSITIVNKAAEEGPKYLDLTHLGPKHKTGFNIKLPDIQHSGASVNLNINAADKGLAELLHGKDTIVVPGHKEKQHTIINVPAPEKEWPEKRSKLVVDIKTAPKIHDALIALQARGNKSDIERVNIQMPAIDLSKHLPAGKDVVVELKPLLKFPNVTKERPVVDGIEKRVDIAFKNITLPRIMGDKNISINTPQLVGPIVKHMLPKHMLEAIKADGNNASAPIVTSTTIINMPNKTLPSIPVPKDAIAANLSLPIKLPLGHLTNGSDPAATINVAYKEEWVGGNPVLPNPGAKVAAGLEKAASFLSGAKCQPQCCAPVETEVCEGEDVQTATPELVCEDGFALDAKRSSCVAAAIDAKVSECPDGMSKCSIAGKGVCVPQVEGKMGHDACNIFKALCHKGTILAKSCA